MIPQRTKQTIDDYVSKGWEPGHFVSAVLANDLKMAVASADAYNLPALYSIVCYVYNKIPEVCQGSYEKVDAWLKMHRERKEKEQNEPSSGI